VPAVRPFTLLLLACVAAAHAGESGGDDAMDTDRPDFSESSYVVGADHWQIEAGVTADRYRAGGLDARTVVTPFLVRIGLGRTTELRIETDGIARVHETDATGQDRHESGFSDTAVGLKWHALDNEGWQPSLAWLLHVETPSGTRAFRGTGLRPSLRAVNEWELSDDWSFGMMPGVFVGTNDDGRRYTSGLIAATLGRTLAPRWHTFLEFAGQQFASTRNGGNVETLDTGIIWLAAPDLQFDLDAAHGLTAAAPRVELGLGISARF
jgi:hypothetical protein